MGTKTHGDIFSQIDIIRVPCPNLRLILFILVRDCNQYNCLIIGRYFCLIVPLVQNYPSVSLTYSLDG